MLVRHPLQPFDPRNFTEGALVPERAWSRVVAIRDESRSAAGLSPYQSNARRVRAPAQRGDAADYRRNLQQAQLNPLPAEVLEVRASLRGDQAAINRYLLEGEGLLAPEPSEPSD